MSEHGKVIVKKGKIQMPKTLEIPNCHSWSIWYRFRLKQIELEIKGLELQKGEVQDELAFLEKTFQSVRTNKAIVNWTWKKK